MQFSKLGLSVLFAVTLTACSGNVPNPPQAAAPPQPVQQQPVQPPVATGQQQDSNGGIPKDFGKDKNEPPPPAVYNPNRPLFKYYDYLVKTGGLKLNPPKEFFFKYKAQDALQFTMDEPTNMVVLVVKFPDAASQQENSEIFRQINKDGRRMIETDNHYTLLIRGGNEQLHKLLLEALNNYDKNS